MDLSDNEIVLLENFPLLKNMEQVFVCNNLLSGIKTGLGKNLPKLETLNLMSNEIEALADVEPLGELKSLKHLTLLENPVSKHEHYRAYVIFKCKNLETLDFTKVKNKERWQAEQLFTGDAGEDLLSRLEGVSVAATGGGSGSGSAAGTKRQRLNEEQEQAEKALKARIVEAIQKTKTLEDVSKLQRALQEGQTSDKIVPLLEQIEAAIEEEARQPAEKRQKADQ